MIFLKVAQGATLYKAFQAHSDVIDAPLTGRYLSTDPITGIIWPAGADQDSALAIAPVLSWIDAANAIASYNLTAAQTASLPPGQYRTSARVGHAGNIEDILECDLLIDGTGMVQGVPPATSIVGPGSNELALSPIMFATDENIAVACMSDFVGLLPDSQMMAWGSDGVFNASDPWTLVSPSNNFTTQLPPIWSQQGAQFLSQVGYVVWLRKPQSAFPAGGIIMGIAAASNTSLTLRRPGMPSGWGQAPSPASGLVGVEFQICSFYPQIERAVYQLRQEYLVSDTIIGRSELSMKDLRVFQDATVATVLMEMYSSESRTQMGDYSGKFEMWKNRLGELKAVLQVRWKTRPERSSTSNLFSTRIVR